MSGVSPIPLSYEVNEPISGADATLSPMIFLHGLTGAKEHWEGISSIISDKTRRKAYIIDSRNHGDSEWSDDFNFDINVVDLFHFMDTHKIPKAVIIGQSMGGITGIKAALQMPERVEKLIVEDMYVKKIPKTCLEGLASCLAQLQGYIENLPNNLSEDQVKRKLLEALLQNPQNIPDELKSTMEKAENNARAWIVKRKPDGKYAFKVNVPVVIRALRDGDAVMSEPKGLYSGSACFICGELSQFEVHKEEAHIRQFFPKADFVCIKGATHAVHFEFPTEFIDAAVQFILKM